ncbi:hypothetical protein B7486_54575, partial [cyanobacterium TDX16]
TPADRIGPGPIGLVVLLSTIAVLVVAVVVLGDSRRRRLRADGPPARRVQATWGLAVEDLQAAGLRTAAVDTPAEVAARAGELALVDPADTTGLAAAVTAARWAPEGISEQGAAAAAEVGTRLERAVAARLPTGRRWARRLDPRRLWRRPGGRA